MTLSARIAVGPSARLASAAFVLAAGGVAVSAATIVARRPDAAPIVLPVAALVALLFLFDARRRHRRAARCVLAVSARAEIDVRSDGPLDGAWRLGPTTMTWGGPGGGFSVVGLVREPHDRALPRTAALPILHGELPLDDARRLGRYLRWALRGGGTAADARIATDGS